MPITAQSRLCTTCRELLPEPPAAPACASCGRVHCPHHAEWPPLLRWWLIAQLANAQFLPWLHPQTVWENLLRDALNGVRSGTGPNPHGVHLTMSTPAVELYPRALEIATAWRAAGSPLEPAGPARNVA